MFYLTCANCGKSFTVQFERQCTRQYCCRSCYMSARNRTELNPAYKRDLSGEKNPMFGRGRKGADNPMFGKRGPLAPRWKGGRKSRPDGYTFVVAPPGYERPSYVKPNGTAYVLEHRLVMERALGRPLTESEVIHHKDGNPRNNAIDNLELFESQSAHIKIAHPGHLQAPGAKSRRGSQLP